MSKLRDYIELIKGVSYTSEDVCSAQDADAIPILRTNNIQDDGLNFDDVIYIKRSKVASEQRMRPGDIIVCASCGSKKFVGRAAAFRDDMEMSFCSFCVVVRPKNVHPFYLGHFFETVTYRDRISKVAGKANNKNLQNEHINNLDITVPSIERQAEISELLDEVSKGISLHKQQLTQFDELIKSRFVELFGAGEYATAKAADVCDLITKGATPTTGDITEEYESGKIPYLKMSNLSFTGELLFHSSPQYVPAETHEKQLVRSKVFPNDVLMNIVGPPWGKYSLVTNEFDEWNINQAIAVFRAKEKIILPRYLMAALMQPDIVKKFKDQAVGVRQLNLSLEHCRNIEIPLPPLEEQQSFVEFSDQVEKAKSSVRQCLAVLEELKESLLQKYLE